MPLPPLPPLAAPSAGTTLVLRAILDAAAAESHSHASNGLPEAKEPGEPCADLAPPLRVSRCGESAELHLGPVPLKRWSLGMSAEGT